MSNDTRNFILAIGLSIAIFFGFNYLYPPQKSEEKILEPKEKVITPEKTPSIAPVILERNDAKQLAPRIQFENDVVRGSINTKTGAIDDLFFKKYKETADENSPIVGFLHPKDTAQRNLLEFDVSETDNTQERDIPWNIETTEDRCHVKLMKTTERFTVIRSYRFNNDYTIDVTDQIQNQTSETIKIRVMQKMLMSEHELVDSYTVVNDKSLSESTPSSIKKKEFVQYKGQKGWIGAGNKYWMAALINKNEQPTDFLLLFQQHGFEMRSTYPVHVLKGGETVTHEYQCFCGPKDLDILEQIRSEKGVEKFDLAVDFGWFYFINKPILEFVNWLYSLIGNFGIAIIILTTLMKVLLYPLAIKSHKSMVSMRRLNPKIQKIKEKYQDDKMRMNHEIMALYKKENVKPMGGCLPILLQIPIFFCLYKVLSINIQMRHTPFVGWIKDLSAADPTSFINLFGLLPFEAPKIFMIGLLPILMGITMFLQQKLTPQAHSDPHQERMMMFLPIFMTYVFASFPSGLVLYWLWGNLLSILQQIWLNRRYV